MLTAPSKHKVNSCMYERASMLREYWNRVVCVRCLSHRAHDARASTPYVPVFRSRTSRQRARGALCKQHANSHTNAKPQHNSAHPHHSLRSCTHARNIRGVLLARPEHDDDDSPHAYTYARIIETQTRALVLERARRRLDRTTSKSSARARDTLFS